MEISGDEGTINALSRNIRGRQSKRSSIRFRKHDMEVIEVEMMLFEVNS